MPPIELEQVELASVDFEFPVGSQAPDWTDAACAHTSAEDWYPEGMDKDERREHVATLKRICGYCPLQQACLSYARANDEQYGIWGGVDMERPKGRARKPRKGKEAPLFTSVSGARGVSWNKDAGKWEVKVQVGGVRRFGGFYEVIDEASAAAGRLREEMKASA